MRRQKGAVRRSGLSRARRIMAPLVVTLILVAGPALTASGAQPPATTAAQDGFVPVDESKPQEQLPAAPLVMAAYGIAWVVIFGYVWTLWSRLSRVERELGEVSRRLAAAERR